MTGANLLGIPETLLNPEPGSVEFTAAFPDDSAATQADLEALVKRFPTSSLVWALLSDRACGAGETIASYAFARVGYHRGLDALRKGGWRGQGPVPWSHEPNRGVLRSLYALRRASQAIGETDEVLRLTEFLNGADPSVIHLLDDASDLDDASSEGA